MVLKLVKDWATSKVRAEMSADDVMEAELKDKFEDITRHMEKMGRSGLFLQFNIAPKKYKKQPDGTERFWDWNWTLTCQRRKWHGNHP